MHGIDKGINPNIQLEKQVIKPVISSEAKGVSPVKQRIGQGRVGIKQKMFKCSMSQQHDKPEQWKSLPGRKPIIHTAERPLYNNLKMLISPKHNKKFHYQKVQDIMIRSFKYMITQSCKQCQSMIQSLKQ